MPRALFECLAGLVLDAGARASELEVQCHVQRTRNKLYIGKDATGSSTASANDLCEVHFRSEFPEKVLSHSLNTVELSFNLKSSVENLVIFNSE